MRWAFKKEAREEFRQAYQWYDERSLKTGDEFIEAFNAAIEEICDNPNRLPPFYSPRIRKAQRTQFPYQIIYRVGENQIVVMIIRHEKRHPEYGLNRL